MTMFWIGVGVSVGLLALILLWPRRRPRDDVDREAANVALYEQRRGELEVDLRDGRLSADEHAVLLAELGAGLVRDAAPVQGRAAASQATDASPGPAGGGTPSRSLRLALLGAMPVVAVLAYLELGRLEDVDLQGVAQQLDAAESGEAGEHAPAELAAMADKLERRLSSNPDDADGWFLLGRTAINLQEYARAARAFAKVSELVPNEPAPVIYQAQAEFLAANRSITPGVKATVDKALSLSPDHPVMLEMLAVDAFEKGRFQEAMDLLVRGLPQVTDPQQRSYFQEGIARAAAQLGVPVPEIATASPPMPAGGAMAGAGGGPMGPMGEGGGPAPAPTGAYIEVDVSLKPGMSLPPEAVVFVTARGIGGTPMPLAVQRLTVAELPAKVRLDERSAMNPQMTIATAQRVAVSARVSRSGTAMRSADDVEVVSGPLDVSGGKGVGIAMVVGGNVGAPRPLAAGAAAGPAASPQAAAGGGGVSPMTPSGTVVRVLVELGPDVRVPPQTAVYVFAREPGGSPMPVAVRRLTAAELPTVVTLDDTSAMQAGRNLSSAPRVEIVARVSRSGSVTPGPGDVEGISPPLQPKSQTQVVGVLVDKVRR
jgi:cytochrome c-type biogenesis protein CcmH